MVQGLPPDCILIKEALNLAQWGDVQHLWWLISMANPSNIIRICFSCHKVFQTRLHFNLRGISTAEFWCLAMLMSDKHAKQTWKNVRGIFLDQNTCNHKKSQIIFCICVRQQNVIHCHLWLHREIMASELMLNIFQINVVLNWSSRSLNTSLLVICALSLANNVLVITFIDYFFKLSVSILKLLVKMFLCKWRELSMILSEYILLILLLKKQLKLFNVYVHVCNNLTITTIVSLPTPENLDLWTEKLWISRPALNL